VQYVNGPLQQVVSQLTNPLPDQHVASNNTAYQSWRPIDQPCKFLFRSRAAAHSKSAACRSRHSTGRTYNGTGNLILHMVNTGSGDIFNIRLSSDDQQLERARRLARSNRQHQCLAEASVDASVPALKGSIETLSARQRRTRRDPQRLASDDTLRLPAKSRSPEWSHSRDHSCGRRIKDGLSMPSALIGGVPSHAIQLRATRPHHHAGDARPMCGPLTAATGWACVPTLAITVHHDLVASGSLQPTVPDWVSPAEDQRGSGLCGALTTNTPFTATWFGYVSFAPSTQPFQRHFSATYRAGHLRAMVDTHSRATRRALRAVKKQHLIPFNIPPSRRLTHLSFKADI